MFSAFRLFVACLILPTISQAASNVTAQINDSNVVLDPASSWSPYSSCDGTICCSTSSTASFVFSGTAVYVLAIASLNDVFVTVSLDDQSPSMTVDVPSSAVGGKCNAVIFSHAGLASGQHYVNITLLGSETVDTFGCIVLTGFTYTTDDLGSSQSAVTPTSTVSPSSTAPSSSANSSNIGLEVGLPVGVGGAILILLLLALVWRWGPGAIINVFANGISNAVGRDQVNSTDHREISNFNSHNTTKTTHTKSHNQGL